MTDGYSASVSILMPVLLPRADTSSLRLLRRSLKSVLDQSYPGAFEIIVIDDGSPVPVRDTMREAGLSESPAIRWLRNDRNHGLVQSLNTGLQEARYELIARQDAGDYWMTGKVAAQMKRFEADPDLSLIATGMALTDENGKEMERHVRRDGWENILRLAAEDGWNPFPHASILALTSVYRLLGGYSHAPAWVHAEDWHLWSIWIRFFKPAMVEELLCEYRQSPGSVSNIHSKQQRAASCRIHRRLSNVVDWKTHPENIQKLADLLGVNLLQCGAICYRLWRYRPVVKMPMVAVDLLRRILPDRDISIGSSEYPRIYRVEDLLRGFPGERQISASVDDVVVKTLP